MVELIDVVDDDGVVGVAAEVAVEDLDAEDELVEEELDGGGTMSDAG